MKKLIRNRKAEKLREKGREQRREIRDSEKDTEKRRQSERKWEQIKWKWINEQESRKSRGIRGRLGNGRRRDHTAEREEMREKEKEIVKTGQNRRM